MKVTIIGAGPAGLYLAILLKKADPSHEVDVVERNAPDATFGWGVVFSDQTLGALRDADLQTHLEITDTFARWEAVDIHYKGELLRSRGHAFAGIARRELLAILQRRCHELGVKMEFGVEMDDPGTVDADLVVGADGVNSVFRRAYADAFGSVVEPQGCKYVWFGTNLVLDAFRFIFKETDYGVFQVHSYPFDENTSTFIVECPEPVWRAARLDRMDEDESIAFCADLFADELDGHVLMSNRSTWLDFLRVRNKTWHRRDGEHEARHIVLLGDAAHTAHFSIGSGTKLAMEDAIALANACVRHDDSPGRVSVDSIRAAVTDYELERQPIVERVQQAADESATYFARVSQLTHLQPRQFAFNLLTRSGRISHASLAVRDPEFVRRLDGWFAGTDGIAPPPLFAPLTIGGVTLRNRVAVVQHGAKLAASEATGAGLILTEFVAVSPGGRISPDTPTMGDGEPDHVELGDEHVSRRPNLIRWRSQLMSEGEGEPNEHVSRRPNLIRWRSQLMSEGEGEPTALVILRLGHAGGRGATQPRQVGVDLPLPAGSRWPLVSASGGPYGPLSASARLATKRDLDQIRDDFAAAAASAADEGYDALELDAAHGYLLASFLSPLSNQRDDEYGGTLANRMRFPLEVIEAVRATWPKDHRLLAVRLTATDWARGGLTAADGVEIARAMADAGAELIHVTAGQAIAADRPEYRRGYLTKYADRIRTEARVPVLVGGHLTTLDEVNTIVAAGRADLCVLELAS